MIYKYNKLVRDKIPEQINNVSGRNAIWHILDDEKYLKELNKKLLEEAHEFIEENSTEELADMMEVIETIMQVKNIDWEQVKKAQKDKKKRKGGFQNKIYLELVEEDKQNFEEEKELNKEWRKRLSKN